MSQHEASSERIVKDQVVQDQVVQDQVVQDQVVQDRVVKGLGEIAFRVNDLDAMQAFYSEVIGLNLMRRFEHIAFFDIAPGYGHHTQILALFDRAGTDGYQGLDAAKTTVDHIAFTIDLADFEAEKVRLEQLGLQVDTAIHTWVQWRSLYVNDPEGNRVEFVCFDASIDKT
ncbi:MAG: VOC family protein [Deinococcota bacterium]